MSLLVSASDSLKIWEFHGEDLRLQVASEYPSEELQCVAWNHTNQVVATAGIGRKVYLVQVNNGQILSYIPFSSSELINGDIASLAFSHNSRNLAAGAGRNIHVWDLKTKDSATILQTRGLLNVIKFYEDGQIASGESTGTVKLWNIKSNLTSPDLIPEGSRSPVTCLEVSHAQPPKIAAGYEDGSLTIFDANTQNILRRQILHNSMMTSMAFSPKNLNLLATGGYDGRINLIDIGLKSSGNLSASIDTGERITAMSFHEDAVHAAIGTTTGLILLYDWRNVRKPISRIPAHQNCAVNALRFQSPTISKTNKQSLSPLPKKSADSTSSSNPVTSTALPSGTSTGGLQTEMFSEPSETVSKKRPLSASPAPTTRTTSELPLQAISADNLSVSSSARALEAVNERGGTHPGLPPVPRPPSGSDRIVAAAPVPISGSGTSVLVRARALLDVTAASSNNNISMSSVSDLSRSTRGGGVDGGVRAGRPDGDAGGTDKGRDLVRDPDSPTGPSPSERHGFVAFSGNNRKIDATQSIRETKDGMGMSTLIEELQMDGLNININEFDDLKKGVRPVSHLELKEALAELRYDVHKDLQIVIKEQIRQFSIAKDDMAALIGSLSQQLSDVMQANAELRAENERLRRIY